MVIAVIPRRTQRIYEIWEFLRTCLQRNVRSSLIKFWDTWSGRHSNPNTAKNRMIWCPKHSQTHIVSSKFPASPFKLVSSIICLYVHQNRPSKKIVHSEYGRVHDWRKVNTICFMCCPFKIISWHPLFIFCFVYNVLFVVDYSLFTSYVKKYIYIYIYIYILALFLQGVLLLFIIFCIPVFFLFQLIYFNSI